ncbi:MAG: D-alanyl-D-alanine carboxypeptidase [Oscillospiraceae bacterium]|nr:D-alanyl-D-alanine carboxypeptidase [Oscillospiraceae bacterium]
MKIEKLKIVLAVLIVFLVIYFAIMVQIHGKANKEVIPIALEVTKAIPKENTANDISFQIPVAPPKKEVILPSLNEESYGSFSTDIESEYAVLVDLESEKILTGKNIRKACYPASLTKILTAYTALELAKRDNISLEDTVTLPTELFGPLNAQGASMAGFLPNENVRLIDLIYGTLLPSGADATVGLAYFFCSGSGSIEMAEECFVDIMNEYALKLGALDTHFVTSSGLHDPEHYSTVYDVALILTEALKDPTFKAAFTEQDYYHVPPSNMHPDGFTLLGTFWRYRFGDENPDFTITGAKTGFTDEAGQCLASLAVKNGKEYIAVTCKGAYLADTDIVYGNYLP